MKRDDKEKAPECISHPEYCFPCMEQQKLEDTEKLMNYSHGKLWVELPSSTSMVTSSHPFGTRSPTRISISVDITDSIHVVKLKIMQRSNIQPIHQELSYRGKVLENAKTVYDCRLVPG